MRSSFRYIAQDWHANKKNIKARFVLIFFRLASLLRATRGWKYNPLALSVGVSYRIIVEWLLGIELPWKTQVGGNLQIYHGVGLVVNDGVVIGSGVQLRHGVTIGTQTHDGGVPIIEDNVQVGCGAVILGEIKVGHDSIIGANSVVTKDVPAGAIVAGVPARIVGSSSSYIRKPDIVS